jgi:hypothetical protein
MKKSNAPRKQSNAPVLIIAVIVIFALLGVMLYLTVLKPKPTASVAVAENNKTNAAIIKAEQDKAPVVITAENKPTATDTSNSETQANTEGANASGPQPTIDSYGPSTDLTRPNISGAVIAVQALYDDFISKIYDAPFSEQQVIADKFVADDGRFSPDYTYLSGSSIHLIPQGAGQVIPNGLIAHSSIIDPNNPGQTIVQMNFKTDNSWSLVLTVRMKDATTIGIIQRLTFRMGQIPL